MKPGQYYSYVVSFTDLDRQLNFEGNQSADLVSLTHMGNGNVLILWRTHDQAK